MLPWFDDNSPEARASDAEIDRIRSRTPGDLEILVALQALPGYDQLWNTLAALIEEAPAHWRWWIRLHPRVLESDPPPGWLLTIRQRNVVIEEAASLPLPALLRRMDVHLSLSSGSAVEASMFGLSCIFMDEYASEKFPHLRESGTAEIVTDIAFLRERLSSFPREEGA